MPHADRPTRQALLMHPPRWLRALLSPQCEVKLLVCRYHHRQGAFDSHEQAMDQHLVSFVEQGQLSAAVQGRNLRVQPGEILWVPPGCARRYYGAPDAPRTRQYNLRFTLLEQGQHLTFLDRPRRLRQAWPTQPTFQQLYDLFQHGHPYADVRLRSLLAILTTTWLSIGGEQRERARRLTPGQRLRLNQFVVDHIAEPIGPEHLAREVELTLDYFSRLFRATYGVAPRTFLKQERVRLAGIRLRETDLTVAEVAHEFGMQNVSLFCRQFRHEMGCTPSEYRKQEAPPVF